MNTLIRTVFTGILGSVLLPALAYGGAWTLPTGTGQVIVSQTMTDFDHMYQTTSKVPRYAKFEVNANGEYGVTDWLTGIVGTQILHAKIDAPTSSSYTGLGYTELGGRARFYELGPSVFSVQATARIPGASNDSSPAQMGFTGFEADIRGLAGTSFKLGEWDSFADVQAGYRLRAGGPANEYRIDATLGTRPVKEWLLLLQSFNTISDGAGGPGFPKNRLHKLQASAVWDFSKNWSVQAGLFVAFAGENTGQERGFTTAIWYRF